MLCLIIILFLIWNLSADCNGKDDEVCNIEENELKECKKILKHYTARTEMVGPDFPCNSPIDFTNDTQLLLNEQDPFLLLHEFGPRDWKIGENKGVPLHPHAGFESVTYIKMGESKHVDTLGNEIILYSGDFQWLTSGKGVMHSESTQHPGGIQHGFQFWINLKSEYKYITPKYQFVSNVKFPYFNVVGYNDNVKIKVIVGHYQDKMDNKIYSSPINTYTNIYILDINIINNEHFIYNIPSDESSLSTFIVYVYEGFGAFKNGEMDWINVERKSGLKFDGLHGDCIEVKSRDSSNFGFILMIGEPIKEKVFGDNIDLDKGFIMNSQKEVDDFIQQYKNGTFVQNLIHPQILNYDKS